MTDICSNEQSEPLLQGKQLAVFIFNIKYQISSENQNYGKSSENVNSTASQYLGFLMSLVVMVDIIFLKKLMLYIMKCYHLGDQPKSADQYLRLIW